MKLAILNSGNSKVINALKTYFNNKNTEVFVINELDIAIFKNNRFDLCALIDYSDLIDNDLKKYCKFINLHPSLLPAFQGKNAIEQAFNLGVKVSGITIHYISDNNEKTKIIAQYPIFIDETMNLIDIEEEFSNLECKLYPLVIESVLKNNAFSFKMLFESKNNHEGCGGCGHCNH